MSPANVNAPEEIIEKKATAPVAMSCLVIGCVALLGAIAFQVAEIAGYLPGSPGAGEKLQKNDTADFKKTVEAIIKNSPATGGTEGREAPEKETGIESTEGAKAPTTEEAPPVPATDGVKEGPKEEPPAENAAPTEEKAQAAPDASKAEPAEGKASASPAKGGKPAPAGSSAKKAPPEEDAGAPAAAEGTEEKK